MSIDWVQAIDATLGTSWTPREPASTRVPRWHRNAAAGEAFTAYVGTHGAEIRRLAHAICCDWDQAETLTSTLLASMYDRWHRFDSDAAADRFVCAALASARVVASATPRSCSSHDPDVPMEDESLLFDGLQSLSVAERKTVVLHDWLDLPITDVAALMSLPVESVTRLAAQGRSALALLLSESA